MSSADSRARWARNAAGWAARADEMRRTTMPVSVWMLDAVMPQPGHDLLELAAGPGDLGLLAAELVAPTGTVIVSDFSPEMVRAAQERATAQGVRNVRFRQIDAQSIDQDAASLDGVLCRWGYMLMPDPVAALRETRRVLRRGARVALAAWAGPDENPWSSVPNRETIRRGLAEPPDPAAPGQFRWAQEGAVAAALEEAGFVEHRVEAVDFEQRYASLDAWWDTMVDLSGMFSGAVAGLDAATLAELRAGIADAAAPHLRPDGSVVLPARTWVASATA